LHFDPIVGGPELAALAESHHDTVGSGVQDLLRGVAPIVIWLHPVAPEFEELIDAADWLGGVSHIERRIWRAEVAQSLRLRESH
jgi:hypothetical protein